MSVYKPFTTSDVVVTPFKVNKSFTFTGASEFTSSNAGIDRFFGKNTPYISGSNLTGEISTQNKTLIYESVKQLYYSNFLNGQDGSPANLAQFNNDGTITVQGGSGSYQPMYDNYLPDTLAANRLFPTVSDDNIGIISIPSNLFGEYIKPGTFTLTTPSNTIVDDGEGNLMDSTLKVGDIVYQHGMVILTAFGSSITGSSYGSALYGTGVYGSNDISELNEFITGSNITCSFQSTTTIYESQYKCTLRENEYNYTQNPSAISSSLNSGIVHDFLTGSYFEPYITTVGLYNNANQLVAVGKLAQPLQSSNTTDTTILVNLDL
tara:strand:+ start:439 stop:1401 length:963 start_codon:yes stop_codon:yes gene_type:complete